MFKGRDFFEEEEQEDEIIGENEDLQEHQRAKDTHRLRRMYKEKKKQEGKRDKSKSKGKKNRFNDDYRDDFHY